MKPLALIAIGAAVVLAIRRGRAGQSVSEALQKTVPAPHNGGTSPGWLSKVWTFFKDIPASILAILLIWFFNQFPGLRPWEPPQEVRASISNVALAERGLPLPGGQGVEMLVVLFDIETVGYDRKEVRIATLLLDPVTGERIGASLRDHALLYDLTRTERSVVWLEVPYPNFEDEHSGCVIVRVFAYELAAPTPLSSPLPTPAQPPTPTPVPTPLTRFRNETILAYADTAPFDPYVEKGPGSCPSPGAPATPPA